MTSNTLSSSVLGSKSFKKLREVNELALLIILGIIIIFLSLATESFFSVRNLSNILGQVSMAAIATSTWSSSGCRVVIF